jgi:hypothetical protein
LRKMNISDTFFFTSSIEAPKLQRPPEIFMPSTARTYAPIQYFVPDLSIVALGTGETEAKMSYYGLSGRVIPDISGPNTFLKSIFLSTEVKAGHNEISVSLTTASCTRILHLLRE